MVDQTKEKESKKESIVGNWQFEWNKPFEFDSIPTQKFEKKMTALSVFYNFLELV